MSDQYPFFAYLSRMRYINRWGLMRNTFQENIQEHSHMVAVLAHALAVIRRDNWWRKSVLMAEMLVSLPRSRVKSGLVPSHPTHPSTKLDPPKRPSVRAVEAISW